MTKEEIIEGNKLIARFMSSKFSSEYGYLIGNEWFDLKQLFYHSSWNQLMPVLEKIESLIDDGYKYDVVIGFKTYCGITRSKNMMRDTKRWESSHTVNEPDKIYTWKPSTKIEGIWIAVVKFLKDYNDTRSN